MSGPIVKQMRVKRIRTAAMSVVEKGAAVGSDAYMLQAAPAFVADPVAIEEIDYPIVALVQEHLSALEGEDLQQAAGQIVEIFEQGAVAERLQTWRANLPSYQLWDAFCSAYYDASSDDEKAAVIGDFADVLKGELILGDTDALMQWQARLAVVAEPTEQADPDETPADGEPVVAQSDLESGEQTPTAPAEPETHASLTQADVEALIQAALTPLQQQLADATTERDAAAARAETAEGTLAQRETELEAAKTAAAVAQSRATPQSRQPDGSPDSPVVTQSEASPYAGSHVDGFLSQHFAHKR